MQISGSTPYPHPPPAAANVDGFVIHLPPSISWELRLAIIACAVMINLTVYGARDTEAHTALDASAPVTPSRHGSCWPWCGCCGCTCSV